MKDYKVNNFWQGITNELRSTALGVVWYAENLDVGRGKSLKQVANNQAENAGSYSVNNYVTKLIQVGTDVYGLGQENNTSHDAQIWTKTNALDSNWGAIAASKVTGTFAGGDALFASLNGYVYFSGGNDQIAKYQLATPFAFNASWKPLTGGLKGGTIWQGNIYGWNGQNVYELDPVADTLTDKIAIPSDQTIVDIVPYGNLLLIICTSTVTVSRMYIWDGVTTTTFTDIVDIGMGTVSGGAMLEGQIVVAINTPNKRTLKLKGYNGGQFSNLFTYTGRYNRAGTYNYVMPASKLKVFSGFVYFIITGTRPDGTYAGLYEYSIARYGREEPINPMTFSIYKTLDFTSARGLDGQVANNDFLIVESIVGGSDTVERAVYAVINSDTNKTTFFESSLNTYTAQAGVFETVKFAGQDKNGNPDPSIVKALRGIAVYYEALPTVGQVVCKYKKDEELTWTTIFTDTTDNAVSHEAINIEATGAALPAFKELQLRFELTGGAELTGYKIRYEELANILK